MTQPPHTEQETSAVRSQQLSNKKQHIHVVTHFTPDSWRANLENKNMAFSCIHFRARTKYRRFNQ